MDERALFIKFWEHEAKTTHTVLSRIPKAPRTSRIRSRARPPRIAWQIVCEEKMIIEALESGTMAWNPTGPQDHQGAGDIYHRQSIDIIHRWKALPHSAWDGPVAVLRPRAAGLADGLELSLRHRPSPRPDHTYLRPMGSTVPQIYGPSGDEP
jgi:hypothetical protein